MRVLDVAAGKGSSARPAQELGADVLAVDISPVMVDALVAAGLNARVMDGERLDVPDDSFDAVLCGFGLFFYPDPVQGARELKRVVKAGGPVACSMPLRTFPDYIVALRQEFAPKAQGPGIPTPRPDFDGVAVLREAGFADVEVVDEMHEFTFDSPASVWEFCLTTGVRDVLNRLSESDRAELETRARAGAGDDAADGPVTVPMSARYWLASG